MENKSERHSTPRSNARDGLIGTSVFPVRDTAGLLSTVTAVVTYHGKRMEMDKCSGCVQIVERWGIAEHMSS